MDQDEIKQWLQDIDTQILRETGRYHFLCVSRKTGVNKTMNLDNFVQDTIRIAIVGARILRLKRQRSSLSSKLK